MPVLPDVGSMSVEPGLILPCASSASIMLTPMRSLTLPIGLKNSSFARRLALTPFSFASRARRTSGVSPIVSVMESKMRPRPGSWATVVGDLRAASAIERSLPWGVSYWNRRRSAHDPEKCARFSDEVMRKIYPRMTPKSVCGSRTRSYAKLDGEIGRGRNIAEHRPTFGAPAQLLDRDGVEL